jgi:hypothetical protein
MGDYNHSIVLARQRDVERLCASDTLSTLQSVSPRDG